MITQNSNPGKQKKRSKGKKLKAFLAFYDGINFFPSNFFHILYCILIEFMNMTFPNMLLGLKTEIEK